MNKEPFLQVSKRRNKAGWQERLLIRFIALILALIVCGAVIVALVKMNPVDVYKAIWDGAMGSERRIWQTIRDTMILHWYLQKQACLQNHRELCLHPAGE